MRVLLTAFEAYDEWTENSSWLAMINLLREFSRSRELELVTRRYPVDLGKLQESLRKDLERPFDAIIHLGQSPGSTCIKLEAIALNVAGLMEEQGDELTTIIQDGPIAYQSQMPLGRWADKLRAADIPAVVSYHAGTFLCNATLYLTHHFCADLQNPPLIGFVHLPLATEQVVDLPRMRPSLPKATLAKALGLLLGDLHADHRSRADEDLAFG